MKETKKKWCVANRKREKDFYEVKAKKDYTFFFQKYLHGNSASEILKRKVK